MFSLLGGDDAERLRSVDFSTGEGVRIAVVGDKKVGKTEIIRWMEELLEDSSPEVEALCRRVVADMSELSGEELGQFFL